MSKRVYVVEGPSGVEYVRASTNQGAINEIARRTIKARPAKVDDVVGLDPAKIIEAGAEQAGEGGAE